jgi:hypothetical protein
MEGPALLGGGALEWCKDFPGGARAVGEEGLIDSHPLPLGGPQVGPEEEEGQIGVPAVDPGVAPLALRDPALAMGLGHLQTELERTWQPLPIPTHSITSLPSPFCKTRPPEVDTTWG